MLYLKNKHTKDVQKVRTGFSWRCFFFGVFYLMLKGLWLQVGIWFLATVAINLILPGVGLLTGLIYGIYASVKVNDWHKEKLLKEGYEIQE